MKIAVSAAGMTMQDQIDPRFGRARYFIVFDTDTNHAKAHDNTQNLHAAQGAGIQAAETVVRLDAQVVLTGNVGPKAFRALEAAGTKVYLCDQGSVADAVRKFQEGALTETTGANVVGHWAV